MIHELKIQPKYFKTVVNGLKTFECRYNDRNYQIGDILILKEYDGNSYSGNIIKVKINYILDDFIGLKEGFIIMSIVPV